RRLLEGHESVTPEDIDLVIDGEPVTLGVGKKMIRPRIGVNPIAMDAAGEWLYFGPMHGTGMFRVRTADLRDASLKRDTLAQRVERFADKPICDGIAMDRDGNIYLGDLANNAIGVIDSRGTYRVLESSPTLSWVDAFAIGPDGKVYTVANQLHRSPPLHRGTDSSTPPYQVLRFDPIGPAPSTP
ncbi:MAG: L-dopachrome tautomerase-related protein, partial [Myxococcota bacterium]